MALPENVIENFTSQVILKKNCQAEKKKRILLS